MGQPPQGKYPSSEKRKNLTRRYYRKEGPPGRRGIDNGAK